MAYNNNRYSNYRPAYGATQQYSSNGNSYFSSNGRAEGPGGNRRWYNRGANGYSGGRSGRTRRRSSGCKMKASYVRRATGEQVNAPVIYGWMKKYGEFLSFVAVPNKDPGTKKDNWKKFVVTITPGMGKPYLTTGFWDTNKKRLSIPDLGLLCDPNYQDGGYTLKAGTKRR